MSNHRNIHAGLGMALVMAVICAAGSACVEARGSSIDDEAISEATQADVTLYPPGTTFSCTIPGDGPAGREWATLMVGEDRYICYQAPDTNRTDPASANDVSCHELGHNIGCGKILDAKPEP